MVKLWDDAPNTRDGKSVLETPLKGGQKHGWEYTWDEDGPLLLVEPYV